MSKKFDGLMAKLKGPVGPKQNARASRPADPAAPTPNFTVAPTDKTTKEKIITTSPMDQATMYEMIDAVSRALPGNLDYRVIGGVAMAKFGSTRLTKDLDLLVPDNTVAAVVERLLANKKKFEAKQGGGWSSKVLFKSSNGENYNVDIMSPAQLHEDFEYPPGSDIFRGAHIPKPAQLLNMKILAYQRRGKKENDAADILCLIDWMAKNGVTTNPEEVTYADADFLLTFTVQKLASRKNNWSAIGLPPPPLPGRP